MRFGFGFGGGASLTSFSAFSPRIFLLRLVGEISAGELRANHALAIDERDVGHKGAGLTGLICMNSMAASWSAFPTGKVGWNCRMNAGMFASGLRAPSSTSKPFGPSRLLNATQNLSGFLAVRSSSEDERQTQHFAAVAGDQRLSAIRKCTANSGACRGTSAAKAAPGAPAR